MPFVKIADADQLPPVLASQRFNKVMGELNNIAQTFSMEAPPEKEEALSGVGMAGLLGKLSPEKEFTRMTNWRIRVDKTMPTEQDMKAEFNQQISEDARLLGVPADMVKNTLEIATTAGKLLESRVQNRDTHRFLAVLNEDMDAIHADARLPQNAQLRQLAETFYTMATSRHALTFNEAAKQVGAENLELKIKDKHTKNPGNLDEPIHTVRTRIIDRNEPAHSITR